MKSELSASCSFVAIAHQFKQNILTKHETEKSTFPDEISEYSLTAKFKPVVN